MGPRPRVYIYQLGSSLYGNTSPLGLPHNFKMMTNEAILISGFICIGKTYFASHCRKYHVVDIDSAPFAKEATFPRNYFEAIRNSIFGDDRKDKRPKVILLSTHELVRLMLVELRIPFSLVYPHVSLEKSWIARIHDRDEKEQRPRPLAPFFADQHGKTGLTRFSSFTTQCWNEKGRSLCHFVLQSDQYLNDIVSQVVRKMGNHGVSWQWPEEETISIAISRAETIVAKRRENEEALALVGNQGFEKQDSTEREIEEQLCREMKSGDQRRKARSCGICGNTGHNRRTCQGGGYSEDDCSEYLD
jgi:hypothetical protein